MSETETEYHPLADAAKIAFARKALSNGLDTFMGQLTGSLPEMIGKAIEAVQEKQEELDQARLTLRTLETVRDIQDGRLVLPVEPSRGSRSPRSHGAAIEAMIIEILTDAGSDGELVASILDKIVPEGSERQRQTIRNHLSQLTRKGTIGHSPDGHYMLP